MLLTGCESIQTITVPLPDAFHEIHEEPYKLHVYDCSNKCAKYLRLLLKAGYDAEIGVYHVRAYNYHAVVLVNGMTLDVTRGRTYWTVGKPEYTVGVEDFYKYGDEYK